MGTAFSSNRGDQRSHGVDTIRRLTETDAAEFFRLRREALEREPASFGESVEEHLKTPLDTIAQRLRGGAVRRLSFHLACAPTASAFCLEAAVCSSL